MSRVNDELHKCSNSHTDLLRSQSAAMSANNCKENESAVEEDVFGVKDFASAVICPSESPPNDNLTELLHRLEEQGAEAAQLRQRVFDLERLVILKDNECAELSVQNQSLLEELGRLRNDYQLVSDFYDKAVQESGAARRDLEIAQRQKEHQLNAVLSCLYPALSEAEVWLRSHRSVIPIKSRLEIPVLCLRWTTT